MNKNKARAKHNIRRFLVIGLLIAAIAAVCVVAGNKSNTGQDAFSKSFESDTADEQWYLTVVNKWNPVDENRAIETVELPGGERVDKHIYEPLHEMFADMEADGVYPVVASGYRTQEEQEQIYNDKIAAYEAEGMSYQMAKQETERWVSVPGTSEHQLGLAVDINADGIHSAGYEVYEWLEQNAHNYGFIYRYPPDKTEVTGVENEPWHYRYVGAEAAKEIHQKGICLEEYVKSR